MVHTYSSTYISIVRPRIISRRYPSLYVHDKRLSQGLLAWYESSKGTSRLICGTPRIGLGGPPLLPSNIPNYIYAAISRTWIWNMKYPIWAQRTLLSRTWRTTIPGRTYETLFSFMQDFNIETLEYRAHFFPLSTLSQLILIRASFGLNGIRDSYIRII